MPVEMTNVWRSEGGPEAYACALPPIIIAQARYHKKGSGRRQHLLLGIIIIQHLCKDIESSCELTPIRQGLCAITLRALGGTEQEQVVRLGLN